MPRTFKLDFLMSCYLLKLVSASACFVLGRLVIPPWTHASIPPFSFCRPMNRLPLGKFKRDSLSTNTFVQAPNGGGNRTRGAGEHQG